MLSPRLRETESQEPPLRRANGTSMTHAAGERTPERPLFGTPFLEMMATSNLK
ncbi:predicted protein [Brucella ceti B1/94]|nr:predicted protein [Brucella ceti B1/94]